MLCSRVQKLLSAYCDSELTGMDTMRVRNHLDGCPTCREEMDSLRQVKQLLGSVRSADPPAPFDPRKLDEPLEGPAWVRPAVRALRLDEITFWLYETVDAAGGAVTRAVRAPGNLALAGVALVVVLSVAVLQRPQPSDAVLAHVPETVASDYVSASDVEALLISVPPSNYRPEPWSRFGASYGAPPAAQPFMPVSASLVSTPWGR
jgi:anti-sigma factor RsiW